MECSHFPHFNAFSMGMLLTVAPGPMAIMKELSLQHKHKPVTAVHGAFHLRCVHVGTTCTESPGHLHYDVLRNLLYDLTVTFSVTMALTTQRMTSCEETQIRSSHCGSVVNESDWEP